ncbi:MAG: MFS transporter [Candidatus Bathyarchaeia archaeon]|jgi:DHA1 family purine base/nucleoside efflux pump-like MFS transporter
MSIQGSAAKKSLKSQLFVPALLLGMFLTFTFEVFLSNAMVNVASSLKVTVGTASQILTISSFVGLIVGFVMGFLTVRFKHKSLFLLGVALFGVGALGSFFAPDFASILFFSLFLGIGAAMIGIVVFALIGDFLPLEKKGMAVGLVMGGVFIANLVMPQMTSLITNAAGWRPVLLWVILPISVFSLLFGFFALPSKPCQEEVVNKPRYLEAFKQILSKKSVLACQIGTAFANFAFLAPVYAVSFYRLYFHESLSTGAIFYSIASAMGIMGVIVGGRLINRIGRKPLAVVASAISGIFAVLIAFMPNAWASAAMWMVSAGFASMSIVGLNSLALEQAPGFRGTMMSLNGSFRSVGVIAGLILSGLLLNLYANNFQILYAMFGICGVASAAVVFLFAKDPCKNQLLPTA